MQQIQVADRALVDIGDTKIKLECYAMPRHAFCFGRLPAPQMVPVPHMDGSLWGLALRPCPIPPSSAGRNPPVATQETWQAQAAGLGAPGWVGTCGNFNTRF